MYALLRGESSRPMTVNGWLPILAFCAALIIASPSLGRYMAKVYSGERVLLTPLFGGSERLLYRFFLVDPKREQDWKAYAKSLIIFSLAGWMILYLILRTQSIQPWNDSPAGSASTPPRGT